MIVLICHDQARTRFEVSPGDCCSGFRETGVYEFQVLPDGATLYIDEAAVEPVSTAAGPVLRWQAGFYAGEVSAEVVDSLAGRWRAIVWMWHRMRARWALRSTSR